MGSGTENVPENEPILAHAKPVITIWMRGREQPFFFVVTEDEDEEIHRWLEFHEREHFLEFDHLNGLHGGTAMFWVPDILAVDFANPPPPSTTPP